MEGIWYNPGIMKRLIMFMAAAAVASATASQAPDLSGVFPEDVKTVGIVAMSSVIPTKTFNAGTNALTKAGYRLKVMPNVPEQTVATPERRARLFEEAWLDPEIDLILFARGGQGAIDVVDKVDWEKLRKRDMRVIGFSDVTLVVNTMLAKKAGHPYTGPMLSSFTKAHPVAFKRIHDMLAGVPKDVKLKALKPGAGTVKGLAMGGLLERLHRLSERDWLPDTAGRVIFIENTNKYADRADELLGGLAKKGVFDKAAAVVICDFNSKEPKAETAALLKRFADSVACPVFTGFQYGHIGDSSLIDFRRELTITPDGTLSWKQGN